MYTAHSRPDRRARRTRRALSAWATVVAVLGLVGLAASASASSCRSETFEGARFTVCSFDVTETDLRIFWADEDGAPYGTFTRLAAGLARRGLELTFAMNGGMYGVDLTPIGLLIEDGEERRRANLAAAPDDVRPVPNFYKKPNGVFYVGPDGPDGANGAGVVETEQFVAARPAAKFATQSGPLLVIDGALHPALIEGSSDRKRRNGVGVSSAQVHFAISEGRVNFHHFARLFRDRLGCDDALFLDGGSAPGLYAPALGRNDRPGHGGYGPIIGVVRPAP